MYLKLSPARLELPCFKRRGEKESEMRTRIFGKRRIERPTADTKLETGPKIGRVCGSCVEFFPPYRNGYARTGAWQIKHSDAA